MKTDFEFFIPIEKSGIEIDPVTNDLIVDGPMSTTRRDLQGQRVLEGAVATGLDTFFRLNMPIDWNHLSVRNPTPREFDEDGAPVRFIMGEGIKVYDGPSPTGGVTKRLKARLYFKKKATKDCLEHLNAGGKLYYSIGGSADVRDDNVRRTQITHVAVTPYPANPDCEIGIVGSYALAKSMGLVAADSPAPDPPIQPEKRSTRHRLTAVLDRLEDLAKTLMAGSGAGMGATGGRALGREDLEGDEDARADCQCRGQCKCHQESTDRDESLDNKIRDTSPEDDRRKGTTTMRKIDKSTQEELAALESDPKYGALAKGLNGLFEMLKGGKMDEDDDDTNTGDGGGGGDDENLENEGNEEMGKGFIPFNSYADETVIDMQIEDFNAALGKSLDQRFANLEKAIVRHVDTKMTEMKKSLEASAAPASEMLKAFESFGMRPQHTGGVSGNYQSAESGKPQRSRAQVGALLEKGVLAGRVDPTILTLWEMRASEPNEELLKSLE